MKATKFVLIALICLTILSLAFAKKDDKKKFKEEDSSSDSSSDSDFVPPEVDLGPPYEIAPPLGTAPIPVNADNFVRAETDLAFQRLVFGLGAFGKFTHSRNVAEVEEGVPQQRIIRLNRDTLYSPMIVDLRQGPMTITIPEVTDRFQSVAVTNQNHHIIKITHGFGNLTFTEKECITRYVLVSVRIFVNPDSQEDIEIVRAIQDRYVISQPGADTALSNFVIPNWDRASHAVTLKALTTLFNQLEDTFGMFGGLQDESIEPARRLIGAAGAWGGNHERDAFYIIVQPDQNDGQTAYGLTIPANVPVSWWSVTVYNENGYYTYSPRGAYVFSSVTSTYNEDGTVDIQFGGCTETSVNCIDVPENWNYFIRLYNPGEEILNKTYAFPRAQLIGA